MIKVVQCKCGTNVKFDTEKVTMFEYVNDFVIGLIVCPVCKQLVEVSKISQPWTGGVNNVKLHKFDDDNDPTS